MLSLEGFDALCADQLAAPIDRTSDLLLRFEDDDDAAAVAAELAADGAFVDRRYVPTDVSSLRDLRQVPVAVAVAVLGLGLVAVAHALVLAVRRRRRDLGVLRALGMRPGDASATVRWQATIVAVAAALVGVPAGLIAGRALWLAIAGPIHVLLDVDIPRLLVAGAGAAVVVIVQRAGHRPGPPGRLPRPRTGPAERMMSMAWMSAQSEWRRRAGSLALLALLVTLAGGVTIAAVAGARRADSAFQRFVDATGEPDIQADGFASPGGVDTGVRRRGGRGVRRGVSGPRCRQWPAHGRHRRGRDARRPTPSPSPSPSSAASPADPFMVEGRMFDPDEPARGRRQRVRVQPPSASASVSGSCSRPSAGISSTTYLEQNARRRRAHWTAGRGHRRRHPPQRHRRRPAGRPVRHPRSGLPRALRRRGDPLHVHRPASTSQPGRRTSASARDRSPVRAVRLRRRPRGGGRAPRARRQRHRRRGRPRCGCSPGLRDRRSRSSSPRRSPARRPASAEDRAVATALGATHRGSTPSPACSAVAPAIVVGAVGSVLVADRSQRVDATRPRPSGWRSNLASAIDAFVLVARHRRRSSRSAPRCSSASRGARCVRRPRRHRRASSACPAASAPPGCSGWPWRPARTAAGGWPPAAPSWRRPSASPACSACGRSTPAAITS